uniref:Uncharacterized protein n=1 Tax=Pyrodinium bahamense TaxID=73915 RepID=A0A7S0FIV2_9DINO|mmetsp:Transcript_34081/g.94272  ORF Transcript_34081/g.94272 Transcript_34081/m.94272 type:complete len:167 (+) Transcript_34081:84-584(+)
MQSARNSATQPPATNLAHERKVFPFKPSRPSSPAESRLSTGALARTAQRLTVGPRPYMMTSHGIEFVAEPGPAMHPGLRSRSETMSTRSRRSDMAGLDHTHSRHLYSSTHEFGHHSVANDLNPFLAHERLPKWETTSSMYGVHYRHPEQTYTRPLRLRMPVFKIHQ